MPVEIVAYDSVALMGDAAPTGVWDIAFLGSDPAREALMSFTAAYLEIEATYLVPGTSPLRTAAEVDREGVRVAAPARANYELFLSRNLKRAQLVSTPGGDAAFDLLVTGKVDALAGLTQGLLGLAAKLPGSRIVEGRFMGVQQSIAVPKGSDAGLAYLRRVVEDAKAQDSSPARSRRRAPAASPSPPPRSSPRSLRRRGPPRRPAARAHFALSFTSSYGADHGKSAMRPNPDSATRGPTPCRSASCQIGSTMAFSWTAAGCD